MQTVIYAGLRNPGRDQAIAEAMASMPTAEVCEQFKINPSTARKAAKRISDLHVYELKLTGGGKEMSICTVAAKSFRRAALGAYRHYCGTFRNLELPQWQVTDGTSSISIIDLRNLDTGMASVTEDDERNSL
ncbi:hypothetical protein thsps21_12840 [Pseudomonas sp. No.21]|uniref:hypothetical protein n=1 Tax=Pseudomonas tohonis TaxID=2725477 RepID=UPI001F2EC1A5|nr:hypothetical protein [Pseudomonas tohonis]GJN44928.1 hypothetical protein TUM20249_09140 [Pseudomonas tohonis]